MNDIVEQQLIRLASDSPDINEDARNWFLSQGSKIASVLAEGLTDPRLGAACHGRILLLLRQFAREETLPSILKALDRALQQRDPISLPFAMEALAVFHVPAAIQVLVRLLDDSDPDVVKHAAALMGQTGDPQVMEPLLRLLRNASPSLRYSAAKGLISLGGPLVQDALRQHLANETDHEVRSLILSADK
jgi:HEAT repeat protein